MVPESEGRQRTTSGSTEPFRRRSRCRPTRLGHFSPHERRLLVLRFARWSHCATSAVGTGCVVRRSLDERVAARGGADRRRMGLALRARRLARPDELIEHTLAEVAALPGVDAALAVLGRGRRAAHRRLGLSPEEAERIALQIAGEHERARDRGRLPLPARRRGGDSARPRAGMVVPLRARRPGARVARGAQPLVERALLRRHDRRARGHRAAAPGPRSSTARRFAEARQLAELDSLTGLHNRRSFHESLEREVARARRYERQLALVVLDLDDFKRVNDASGTCAGDAVLAEVGRRMLSRRPHDRHRVPLRRRRVRGDPPRVDRAPTPTCSPSGIVARHRRHGRRQGRADRASAGARRTGAATKRRPTCSSGRTSALYRAKGAGKRAPRGAAEPTAHAPAGNGEAGVAPASLTACSSAELSRRAASRPRGSPPPRRPSWLSDLVGARGWPPKVMSTERSGEGAAVLADLLERLEQLVRARTARARPARSGRSRSCGSA